MFAGHAIRRTVVRGIVLLVIGYLAIGWFSSGTAGKVNELKTGSELALRIATGAPVLVDFTASYLLKENYTLILANRWCMPCKMMAPELDQVAKANKRVEFYKVDIDKHADVAEQYRVAQGS